MDLPPRRLSDEVQCLALVQVAAFADLRRRIGTAAADLTVLGASERVAALLPRATVTVVGRNLIEWRMIVRDRAAAEAAVATLHLGFAQAVRIGGQAIVLSLNIGMAARDGDDVDDVALIEAAELALARGQPEISAMRPSPQVHEGDRDTSRDLKRAVPRGELFLHYQPKLHLRRQEIVSIEALIRWQHPQRGLVLPNDFIPVAERMGDIGAMTIWTIEQAITDQRVLRRNGRDLTVYINIAGVLLSDRTFVDRAASLIQASGARLGFEITETSVIRDPDSAIEHLRHLAAIGVEIAIDDYGAGLSSLAYLKKLPARELKIDKLFVTQLTSSHRDPLIVRSTIDLAHALEMEVVAEGVETATALALLSVMGCDMVQGFLISRPLALEALLAYLRDDQHRAICQAPRLPLERLAAVRAQA